MTKSRGFPGILLAILIALWCAPSWALSRTPTMRRLVRFGLENSPKTKMLFLDSKISTYEYKKFISDFYPQWTSEFNYESLTYPSVLSVDVTGGSSNLIDEATHYWYSNLSQKIQTETEFFVNFRTHRIASSSSNVLLSPYYYSTLRIGGKQPLLKGVDWFGTKLGDTWAKVSIAKGTVEGDRLELEKNLGELVHDLELAYLEFSYLKQAISAYENTIAITQKQLDFVRGKIKAGLFVEADSFQVEERLEARKVDLLQARKDFDRAQSRLMHLLGIDPGQESGIFSLDYQLPPFEEMEHIDAKEFIEKANFNNQEIQTERKRLEVAKREVERARSLRMPSLDVTGSYVLNGGNSTSERGYSADLAQLTNTSTDGFEVGVQFSMPLGPSTERYDGKKAQLAYKRQQESLRNIENQLATDIQQNLRNIHQDKELYFATQKVLSLAEKKLTFEQKKFESGLSTSFQVLTYQDDWTDAFVDHLRALYAYHQSQSQLDFLMGKLLSDYSIAIERELRIHDET